MLLQIKEETIPLRFTHYIVDRVNTETEELELGENREIKIKLPNVVELVTGLRNEGEKVPINIGKLLRGLKN